MNKTELEERYFEWLRQKVGMFTSPYTRLLRKLHSEDFYYKIEMDGNRYSDGVDLRYIFGKEMGYGQAMVASLLDNRPCSVLEMMVALAIRFETSVMNDDEYGDRTPTWFRDMLSNLHLSDMTDLNYNEREVSRILKRFLDRDYARNGDGGLFMCSRKGCDMRQIEIWYQFGMYLEDRYGE